MINLNNSQTKDVERHDLEKQTGSMKRPRYERVDRQAKGSTCSSKYNGGLLHGHGEKVKEHTVVSPTFALKAQNVLCIVAASPELHSKGITINNTCPYRDTQESRTLSNQPPKGLPSVAAEARPLARSTKVPVAMSTPSLYDGIHIPVI